MGCNRAMHAISDSARSSVNDDALHRLFPSSLRAATSGAPFGGFASIFQELSGLEMPAIFFQCIEARTR
jgi:hypothetical protein